MIPRCVGARTRSYGAMEGVCPPPQGPSLQSGLCCPVLHRLIGPIRPTRGHTAISPQSGLPSLSGSAEATHEWFRAFTIIPSWHAVLFDPGDLGHRSVQYGDADTGLRRADPSRGKSVVWAFLAIYALISGSPTATAARGGKGKSGLPLPFHS